MTSPNHGPSTNQQRAPAVVLQALLREIWRYKFIVPAVAAVVTGAVAFVTMRQPRIYEAMATLEYDPHPARPLGDAVQDTASSESSYWNTLEFYETQNYLLKSRALAERVVRKLGLHESPSFNGVPSEKESSFKGVSVETAAESLLKRVTIRHLQDTRIVQLVVRDNSPEQAQLLANSLAESYIERSLEDRLGSSVSALEWLANQMEALKRELESSEQAMYRYREEHQSLAASLDERRRILAGQLEQYTETLTTLRTQRVQTEARLNVLRGLTSVAGPITVQAGAVSDDPSIATLAERYRESVANAERISVTYGEAHPAVRTAQTERDTLAAQLREQIDSILNGTEAKLEELSRAERGIEQFIDDVNRQGLSLSLQEVEYVRLDRERKSKSDLYALVMQRAAETDLTRALRVANARIVDRALKPSFAVSPKVRTALATGLALGLVLGIVVALGVAQLDNKVRGVGDLETRGITVLGVLPAVSGGQATLASPATAPRRRGRRVENPERDLIVHLQPRSTVAECCRQIRTNLTFQAADHPLRALSVTSAMPQDGKTTVSISLAITLAQSGRRVLLVDTDLRKPRLHRAFRIPAGNGITTVLAGEAPLLDVVQTTDVPGLTLLQCGPLPPNPSELLHTRRFAEIVEEAKQAFDLVVFDSPPLGAVTDPAIISTLVDGTLLVVRSRVTTRAAVESALRQLRSVSARLVGCVMNDVDLTEGAYGAYYAYYRGYYADDDNEASPPSPASSRA
jgi:capsular exopolysaccharide synthesis family protein